MQNKLIEYIENSFLSPLLKNDAVTDITYNGADIFYMDNIKGRQKFDKEVKSIEVSDFIRQIANLGEKQFSFTEPILDLTVGRYRINAVHSSIVRLKDEKTISFAIRIASLTNRIKNDNKFMNNEVHDYLRSLLEKHESIVICGGTGTGKTELQKLLISEIEHNSHIIVIDNIQELEFIKNESLDITTWQMAPQIENKSFECLIRNALRNNPDWLIIAESRGKEMSDVLLSVMSGHPVITTLHAASAIEVPNRITRLIQLANKNQQYDEIFNDVVNNIRNYIYLEKRLDKNSNVERYVKSIIRYNVNKKTFESIYERKEQ